MINENRDRPVDSKARDALAALRRAADQARILAIQTNTAIVIVKDGKQVRITAEELRRQAAQQ